MTFPLEPWVIRDIEEKKDKASERFIQLELPLRDRKEEDKNKKKEPARGVVCFDL